MHSNHFLIYDKQTISVLGHQFKRSSCFGMYWYIGTVKFFSWRGFGSILHTTRSSKGHVSTVLSVAVKLEIYGASNKPHVLKSPVLLPTTELGSGGANFVSINPNVQHAIHKQHKHAIKIRQIITRAI